MASSDVVSSISNITSSSASQSDKIPLFTSLLTNILANEQSSPQLTANLRAFVDCLLNDSIGIVTSRPVMTELVASLSKLPNTSETKKETLVYLLDMLKPRIVSFEEQDSNVREVLAEIYETENDNLAAANTLRGITVDSSQRLITDEFRVRLFIRIMRNLLEESETVQAETYLNRATSLIHKTDDQTLNLHFMMCQAKILDTKRDFLNAFAKYLQLSFSQVVDEGERLVCLSAAIICAVLAPAGPARSRSLATLYKDDRAPQSEHYGILEKMYLDRLLSPEEVDNFSKSLQPHQLATNADGTTVLSRAVVEHNLLAVSRLYNNVGCEELSVLLNLPTEKAEEYAARMIHEGRLVGHIDQIDSLIYFDVQPSGGSAQQQPAESSNFNRQTRKWDSNILGLAEEVEKVTSLLQNEYPDFVATHLKA